MRHLHWAQQACQTSIIQAQIQGMKTIKGQTVRVMDMLWACDDSRGPCGQLQCRFHGGGSWFACLHANSDELEVWDTWWACGLLNVCDAHWLVWQKSIWFKDFSRHLFVSLSGWLSDNLCVFVLLFCIGCSSPEHRRDGSTYLSHLLFFNLNVP